MKTLKKDNLGKIISDSYDSFKKLIDIGENKISRNPIITIGSIIIALIYTFALNKLAGLEISYIYIALIGFALSILSQIGDLSASSIKRTVGIKDFGNLIPGHGGMLDRIDSILFIAPFAYFLLMLI